MLLDEKTLWWKNKNLPVEFISEIGRCIIYFILHSEGMKFTKQLNGKFIKGIFNRHDYLKLLKFSL